MRKALVWILAILLVTLAGILIYLYLNYMSPGAGQSPGAPGTPAGTASATGVLPTPAPTAMPDPALVKLASMSLDDKIGQMVISGIDGTELDENGAALIRQYRVGGIILYGTNVKSAPQLIELVNTLKRTNKGNAVPLFIGVDQEGGRIDRMPGELHRFPSARAVGSAGDAPLAFRMYQAVAGEIGSFGFNLDFAPVLDINSNLDNPVIGDRSFGPDAGTVVTMGLQAMKGIRNGGVIPVIKHFPGHGDTSVDSHIGLPVVYHDLDRLKSFELQPFLSAIRNGADAVLMAHILLPQIDTDNPASLSKTIITDVLRNELGFGGVVITDDMTMGAIVKNYDIGPSSVKSILAGSDIILVAHDFELETKVIAALKQAALDGTIPMERIDQSVCRILRLKEKYLLTDKLAGPADVDGINSTIDAALNGFPAEPSPTP
jgi:beta-N-acetylhexosaminidase